ncbi:MAG: beta-ketoacyl-[acyl-carrier-protein] synthase family protein [Planctomycetaceae bacterium]|nr:beta-ketoacyl-[acyl-carrier-protein] synthase family protein [Planctomycetaceae bacterium]
MSDSRQFEPIVITGIGLMASVGNDRESVWRAVRDGTSGVRRMSEAFRREYGATIAAPVDIGLDYPGQIKNTALCLKTASEALDDAGIDFQDVDAERFGCAVSGHMGDTGGVHLSDGNTVWQPGAGLPPWWMQWFPNTSCVAVANRFGLYGPRISHSTACASGLVDVMSAAERIRDDQCDIALAGSSEVIHPLFAAGFQAMRVLAHHDDPAQAPRPFDRNRNGFVMGEGAAMFVIERLSHARRRGAKIYAELAGFRLMSEGHHITSLDVESHGLATLIDATLRDACMAPYDVQYINAHGTGTHQNDIVESRGIRHALGPAADRAWVSSTKSMLGHLINAAGSVELAITALALRDGFAPPTLNLTDPDPEVQLDCIPLVGRSNQLTNALKISVAFGGHMAAVALRRWNDAAEGRLTRDHAAAA